MDEITFKHVSRTYKISIIIPVYNEENNILSLLKYLEKNSSEFKVEILVIDGNSDDNTVKIIRDAGFSCIISNKKGRAAQMNLGAQVSTGEILYFVHADSFPPESFVKDIFTALEEGYETGCFRFKFNSNNLLLNLNSYFTRFNRLMCRGGDQTLFVTRCLFEELNGYNEEYRIMEDFEIIERLQSVSKFKIIPKSVMVSARKYKDNNYLKVNLANLIVFMMYFMDISQETMIKTYSRLIYKSKYS